ncbi:bZIP transcription [Fusarium beomiforme]|uniref:BZIP transcription n=1 Tax=Fusarium beomiforme TaxID=44412 RepID=A0A9P5AMT7_9HYPO|nr:bZIP transcription [Fusarium beomiforme]
MAADAETRRAKKRQTDRNAQRQHRKRQKQYIEGLEAQISLLKSAGKTEASQLAVQNLQLQDELQQMRGLWDEMESILQRQRDLRANSIVNQIQPCVPSDGSPTTSYDSHNERDANVHVFSTATPNPVTNKGLSTREMTEHLEPNGLSDLDDLMLHDPSTTHDLPENMNYCSTLDLDHGVELLNTEDDAIDAILGDKFQLPIENTDNNSGLSQQSTVRNKDPNHFLTIDSIQIHTPRPHRDHGSCTTMTMRWPMSISTPTTDTTRLFRENDDMMDFTGMEDTISDETEKQHNQDPLDGFTELFTACLQHDLPPSRHMPILMFSFLAKDKFLHEMIKRASQNPESIGPPVLIDFLVDNKKNSLSTDLKAYLEPVRKARRTSEYLATYWVLYLLFRWQILQSEDAYHSLPVWLRPTPLQLVVHHPVVADLIAWPAIREGLVQISISDAERVYDVSTDVGKYLTVELSTSEFDLVHDPQQLVSKILDLNNWKLDKEFFNRYPQWKNNTD